MASLRGKGRATPRNGRNGTINLGPVSFNNDELLKMIEGVDCTDMAAINKFAAQKAEEIMKETNANFGQSKPKLTAAPPPPKPVVAQPVKPTAPASKPPVKKNMSKAAKKKANEDAKYFCPNGPSLPYFACHEEDYEEMKRRESFNNSIHKNKLAGRPLMHNNLHNLPVNEIAANIRSILFPYAFTFSVDVFFAMTGVYRRCTFGYFGNDTYAEIHEIFKRLYCNGECFQWFYMNHKGQFLEVHNNATLVEMIITHGAFPKGHSNPKTEIAKMLCVSRSPQVMAEVSDRELDLVFGHESSIPRSIDFLRKMGKNIHFQLAPDMKYKDICFADISSSEPPLSEEASKAEMERRSYDTFVNAAELVEHCQRPLEVDEMFADKRSLHVTQYDLLPILGRRFIYGYKNYDKPGAVRMDIESILNHLKRSKHQTREDYEIIRNILEAEYETKWSKSAPVLHPRTVREGSKEGSKEGSAETSFENVADTSKHSNTNTDGSSPDVSTISTSNVVKI